ncbi:protein MpLEA-like17 [Marchantia polymorpha subsp. ruderalis]|uniref:Uncharacterized protein n=2 Tax=Marchantia polymorpha TaxID=3197 RepID=A0AAF6B4G2_MARPO|nr:hypothetical protein MARPO_0183s0007 [Marchantia polymorpha]BBN06896.1 hypothetical protein Mp_3g24750 [Marchantia polymorpha subsp. ruderalis]|eukprot:PTQ27801.1 hypothetical protein MARPO_0183s0007 [Marchantia polymorpha]
MKGTLANMKEKVHNATAKAELKIETATEKTDKLMADDKAGKEEAHAIKHEKDEHAYGLHRRRTHNHGEKVRYKQVAHDTTMEDALLPHKSNPYVQIPVETAPTEIPHPHLTHEQITNNAGFPEDLPTQGPDSVLPHDPEPEQTNANGFGELHEDHMTHPEAFQLDESHFHMNVGFPDDQPDQGANCKYF